MSAFHNIRFPVSVSFRSLGGPERRTEIVGLESGHEERNSPWKHGRRRYDAGIGVRSLHDIEQVQAFFEARSGRLYGFRWKDPLDYTSAPLKTSISASDQLLGTGDGTQSVFALRKTYEAGEHAYLRPITKPVAGTVLLAVGGQNRVEGVEYTLDDTSGEISFLPGHIPAAGEAVTAGFEFDVPVRFDTDYLAISLESFEAGAIASIPIVEIR
jgi:uncharacterized protein (TIGR02217 family)